MYRSDSWAACSMWQQREEEVKAAAAAVFHFIVLTIFSIYHTYMQTNKQTVLTAQSKA